MRPIRTVLATALSALALGCVESALDPKAQVELSGSALKEDKTPLAQTELSLQRALTSTCLHPADFKKVTTDAQGQLRLALTGAETQADGAARCFRLALPAQAKGGRTSADFLIQVEEPKVPALQQWEGAVSGALVAGGVEVKFNALTKTHGVTGGSTRVVLKSDLRELSSEATSTESVTFSEYVIEDFPLSAQVSTERSEKGSGTTFHIRYTSDSADLPRGTKVPSSRGAGCSYTGAPATCALTDGKLDHVDLGQAPELRLSLGSAKVLKKLAVRGLDVSLSPSTVTVEGSADGTTWSKLADIQAGTGGVNPLVLLDLSHPTAVKELRLTGQGPNQEALHFKGASEVSVFE